MATVERTGEFFEEIKQRYEFSRHLFQQLATWFTVFISVNTGVMGWIVAAAMKGDTPPFFLVLMLSTLLAVQNLLGITACVLFCSDVNRHHNRLQLLHDTKDIIALPAMMYLQASWLMAAACGTYVVAWIALPFIVF